MKKFYLKVKESEGKKFFFLDFGSESHGRTSFRLWVSSSLIERDEKGEYIELPLAGVEIYTGKKDSYILKKGNYNLFYFFVPCGYRGGSSFEVKESSKLYDFEVWESPQGSLGVSSGALILTPEKKLTIKWQRSGRLYGDSPEGTTILYIDGREDNLEGDLEDLHGLE